MYTVLPQPETFSGTAVSFQVTPQEELPEVVETINNEVYVEEFYRVAGNIITLQRFPKEVAVYRAGGRIWKIEFKIKGKNLIFPYKFNRENVVIQYVEDSNHN